MTYTEPDETLKAQRLHVEFADSPKLTAMLQIRLVELGYQIAVTPNEAEAQLRFKGEVSFERFRTTPRTYSLGKLIESEAQASGLPKASEADARQTSLVGVAAETALAQPFGISGMVGLTGLLDWASDATGLRAALNKAVTGDPNGWCFSEACRKYRQSVFVSVSGSGSWFVSASVFQEEIILDRLVEESLARALEPLAPVRQQ